jgi:hypothetical protein
MGQYTKSKIYIILVSTMDNISVSHFKSIHAQKFSLNYGQHHFGVNYGRHQFILIYGQ